MEESPVKSYSEFSEDLWIMENVALPPKGFYVDLGCAWLCLYSNSAFLRDRGWDGANIDGNASYEPHWQGVAPFTHAVIGDGKEALFESNGVPELSRLGSGEIVQTRRLDDLLEFSPKVDALFVDLEGAEFTALQTFDWKNNQPLIVVSEYNTFGLGEDYRVRDMLLDMGYRVVHETKANLIFTK